MKNTLANYLKKHLTCPFGKAAIKQDVVYFISHAFLTEVELSSQKSHIDTYKKFLLDRSINTSLIVILENKNPINIDREQLISFSLEKQQDIISEIQQYLYITLWDVVLWLDMANKNCSNIAERSAKPYAPRPAIDMMRWVWSWWGMDINQFITRFVDNINGYKSVPIVEMQWLNTEVSVSYLRVKELLKNIKTDIPLSKEEREHQKKLKDENRHPASFLMFYMWPLYPQNHARYAPNHNIIINNNADITKISDEKRTHTMKNIRNQSVSYEVEYFPSPI